MKVERPIVLLNYAALQYINMNVNIPYPSVDNLYITHPIAIPSREEAIAYINVIV